MLRVTAAFAVAAGSVFFSQNLMAGGDIIPPGVYDQPKRVQTWTPKRTWSGFYIGGGLGIQQMRADVNIDSKLHSVSEDVHGCKDASGKTLKYDGDRSGDNKFLNKDNIGDMAAKIAFATAMLNCENPLGTVRTNPAYYHYTADLDHTAEESFSGDWKAFGTVMVGYDKQISNSLVLGVFGSADFGESNLDFSHSFAGLPTGTYYVANNGTNGGIENTNGISEGATITGNLKTENMFTAGARFGHLFNNNNTLGFLLAGYSSASVSGSLNMTTTGDPLGFVASKDPGYKSNRFVPTSASKKISETLHGLTVGAGAEHKFNSNWSVRLEYRYTWFNSIKEKLSALEFSNDSLINGGGEWTWARSTENDTTVEIDPSLQSVRATLTYKFDE